jgi:hypothetical protein
MSKERLTLDELIAQLCQLREESWASARDFVAVEMPLSDLTYIERVELVGSRAYIVAAEVDRT